MRILIVGGDAAGMSAASQIRRQQPSWTVEVFEMGLRTSYALCGTPYYVGGLIENLDDLVAITPEEFEKKRGIKVHTEHQVTAVNPAKKSITVKNLETSEVRDEQYDQLLLATGASPVYPKGLEPEHEGVFYLRSIDDAKLIRSAAQESRKAVVIGAGYIGLEMVENLVELGLEVTLVGRKPAPIFEVELQEMVSATLSEAGVDFKSGVDALGVNHIGPGKLEVLVNKGDAIPTDMVVVGVGVRPRSELAAQAKLELGFKKAIAVDRHQRTSNPFIFAAGDCAESYHLVTKTMTHIPLALGGNRQGKTAGLNICEQNLKSPGILGSSSLKVFDLALSRTGIGYEEAKAAGWSAATKTVVTQNSKPHYYPGSSQVTVIIIHDKKTGRLLGGQIAGTMEGVGQRINTLAAAITGGMTVQETAAIDTAYAPPFSPVNDPVIIACEVAAKKN